MEKAHPDVFNVLLQILDDGRVTDSQGRTVDFKNALLIMTSNLGSAQITGGSQRKGRPCLKAPGRPFPILKAHFRPEFLNRIDETACSSPMSRDQIRKIISLQFRRLQERLMDRQLSITLSPRRRTA